MVMIQRLRTLLAPGPLTTILLMAALSACSTPPESNDFPQLTYRHLPPIAFDVAGIEVISAYQPPQQPPNVEHLVQPGPQDAAQQWARDRLEAVGLNRTLRFTVRDASIIETPIELKGGLEGLVTTEQSERYESRLAVTVEIFSDAGASLGSASAEARRSITVSESASVLERERVWFGLTEKIMMDLNGQLEKTLGSVFPQYLRS